MNPFERAKEIIQTQPKTKELYNELLKLAESDRDPRIGDLIEAFVVDTRDLSILSAHENSQL